MRGPDGRDSSICVVTTWSFMNVSVLGRSGKQVVGSVVLALSLTGGCGYRAQVC